MYPCLFHNQLKMVGISIKPEGIPIVIENVENKFRERLQAMAKFTKSFCSLEMPYDLKPQTFLVDFSSISFII